MKRSYKNLLYVALSGLLCSFTVFSADAQRAGRGGGGGGGMRGGGGGSVGISRPSFGGGGGMSRPSMSSSGSRPSFSGGSRPSFGSAAPGPRMSSPSNRPGVSGFSRPDSRGSVSANGRFNNYQGSRFNNYGNRVYARPPYNGRGYYGNRYYGNRYYGNRYYGDRYYGRGYYGGGFYYPYRGFYSSYYMPHIGFSIGVLPFGYYPFYWNNAQYYYSDGLYYQQGTDDQYTVVEPPVGAEIKELPSKAQSIVINGVQYYELNGVYYQPVTKDDGTTTYQIAGKDGELNTDEGYNEQLPLVGDIVVDLPPDTRKVKLNGEKLYVDQMGVYYKEDRDANDKKVYKVVGVPENNNDQSAADSTGDEDEDQ
ncbi:hypothetical protein LT679_12525 [Mucilaginibacter roseus]|uniref:Uncharacterized protein n=1 Tax=Mucilaginibacter roseus TaxID=1528868 RepID=A0ABS8U2T5_9SPHI|nr:DUF6515 family protein [Mucilaginibacter roseus]MCD8741433.1 hypothetical protein [Mucilaginibacter roseus]